MDREQLKALIRTEPTIAETFATVDAEYQRLKAECAAVGQRRDDLHAKLHAIWDAKQQLVEPISPASEAEEITGEPAPASKPATNPQRGRN